tara:strand:- start:343 stop:504 length:162 start_codon:yes stop_codon:yes gene_type:complete
MKKKGKVPLLGRLLGQLLEQLSGQLGQPGGLHCTYFDCSLFFPSSFVQLLLSD